MTQKEFRIDSAGGLPAYRVRVSPRARQVLLKVHPRDGLCVVVPPDFDPRLIPEVVARRKDWISETMARFRAERDQAGCGAADEPPMLLDFRAVAETWQLDYAPRPGQALKLTANSHGRLLVSGEPTEEEALRHLLRAFIRRRATALLPPQVRALAADTGLCPSRIAVRFQRSRWGSCSAAGHVNLNAKILFLPPELARHVLLHELCHLAHLNHGPDFHALLAGLSPGSAELERRLSRAMVYAPAFLG
jgi:predicted metal-dependent hydrolase